MHTRIFTLLLVVVITLAGCSREPGPESQAQSASESDPIEQDLLLRQASERNIEMVVEIARALRDQRGGVQPASQEEVFAAVRQRYSAADAKSDVLNDAWGRPLRYDIVHETEGNALRNGFRVLSSGSNGEFENGGGDDLRQESVLTETVSGG